jgi:putative oxidoreductase
MAGLLSTKNWAIQGLFLSILRIITGFLFMFHGSQKLLGYFGGVSGTNLPAHFGTLPWFAGSLELFGGLLIFVGFLTRPVGFLLSGEMAFAYFMVHFPRGFWPIKNMGEIPVLDCFIFLYLFAAGAGPWSLDHLIWDKSSA